MARRVCSTTGCANLTTEGGRCTTCQAQADKRRRPNGNPYATRGHRNFRAAVLAKHPRCTCAGECGQHTGWCGKVSTVADHHPLERVDLVATGANPDDPNHGRGVCTPCHDRKTARTKPAGWNQRN